MPLLSLLRPHQWVKNLFVFLPLFFSGGLLDTLQLWHCLVAFLVFSFIASSIYCLNDVRDVEADRLHPRKCKRPVASGAISVPMAYVIMGIMIIGSGVLVFLLPGETRTGVWSVIGSYFILNLAYCLKLKQLPLVDVSIISVGFVLRVVCGGMATGIEISHWIVIMTFLLALFLALAKRRDDVVIFEETGKQARANISAYNTTFMNQAITVVATVTLIAYVMYTVSYEVMARFNTNYLYITAIFVLVGILRYLQITIVDVRSGSPVKILLRDRFIQACVLGWIITFLLIIYL